MSARSKPVKFKVACAGEHARLKYSENYVSNSHWVASRKLFGDVQLKDSASFMAALGAKAWECQVEKLADEKMIGKVPVDGRRDYSRTPLHWEDGGGIGHDSVCFLAEDGARLWLRLGYVRVFGIECVSGHGPTDPCAIVVDGVDVLVLSVCTPPNDPRALRVLVVPAAEKPAKKSRVRVAVGATLPDPPAVAAEAAGAAASRSVTTGAEKEFI